MNYLQLVRDVAEGRLNLNSRDSVNQTPLHLAARRSHHEMLEHLLREGAPVDATDLAGRTPLHLAASRRDVRSAELLLLHGANPRAITLDGFTVLYYAVQAGSTLLVELLVNHGCDVNETVTDRDLNRQYSYLHAAVERNHVRVGFVCRIYDGGRTVS